MKNLDLIAEELFNKIRGRFPSITIGDSEGKVTNKPNESRFYDFDYVEGDRKLGKVSISLSDEAVEVMYSNDFVANEDIITRENWYEFLKELRQFSKKRMLKFDTRNINKSNLDQRDYKFLATNRTGDDTMNESKMYGTSKTSYQNVGEARIAIKHSKPVNTESATGRIQNITSIFIESPEGERFKYPFKHLNGARAMARHVAEGGKPFDDFGKHITGLSEELNSLKKFKSYVNRSSVMAEGLSGYMLPVNERLNDIKKTISSLQKESTYRTAFENFEQPVFEDVPEDVAENWIDQLTIKQFNEELKDVFPFVYRLVSEATKAKIVSASDLLGEQELPSDIDGASAGPDPIHFVRRGDTVYSLAKAYGVNVDDVIEVNGLDDEGSIRPGDRLIMPGAGEVIGASPTTPGSTRGINPKDNYSSDDFRKLTTGEALESAFEEMMGQFGEDYGPEEDEFHKGIHVKLGGDPDNWKPHRDRPVIGDHVELKVPKRYKAAQDVIMKMFAQITDIDVNNLDVDYTTGSRSVMIDGETPHPSILSALNGTLDKLDTGEIAGLYKEGNKFSGELDKARKQGKDEIEIDGKKIPVTEFILSMYDRETGQFPKGETAVLTAVEKDYGEEYINPAKSFIEAVNAKFEEFNGYRDPELSNLKEYDDDEYINASEFPKIRTDVKKDIEGYPHIGIEYYNGDMWLLPQATDGKPVFTNGRLEFDELLRRQLKAKGIGFPEKYNGDYTKRDGKWMSVEDAFDYESNASANSPYAKAQKQNKADLAAKGVDFEAELAKARKAGKYPDPRIQDVDDFLGYLMQQNGVQDNTPSTYTVSGFGVDIDDDGYSFKDTSQFIKGGVKSESNDFDQQADESALMGYIGQEKYGRKGMAALSKAGRDGASEEELGRIKDKYKKESEDLRRLAGI